MNGYDVLYWMSIYECQFHIIQLQENFQDQEKMNLVKKGKIRIVSTLDYVSP